MTTLTPVPASEQLALTIEPLRYPAPDPAASIQDRFEAFHALNPWVYTAFVQLTDDWLARGRTRIGMKMLTELLRWEYGRQTTGSEFKLDISFTSRYARLLIDEHPHFAPAFETRVLRA